MRKSKETILFQRAIILHQIGEVAEKRYKENLRATGYKGFRFYKAFHYYIDPVANVIHYELHAQDEKLNQILQWLEYGTGLYGSKKRRIQSKQKSTVTGNRLLLKFKNKETGRWMYRRWVNGIKPGFMFTKAVLSVKHDMSSLRRKFGADFT